MGRVCAPEAHMFAHRCLRVTMVPLTSLAAGESRWYLHYGVQRRWWLVGSLPDGPNVTKHSPRLVPTQGVEDRKVVFQNVVFRLFPPGFRFSLEVDHFGNTSEWVHCNIMRCGCDHEGEACSCASHWDAIEMQSVLEMLHVCLSVLQNMF